MSSPDHVCPACGSDRSNPLGVCSRCGKIACSQCLQPENCAHCAATVLREVLAGGRVRGDAASRKLLWILARSDGDAVIEPDVVRHRYPRATRAHEYYVAAAPAAVRALLDIARIERLEGPLVFTVREGDLYLSRPLDRDATRGVWVREEPAGFAIRVRQSAPVLATAQRVPAEGPLAWPADVEAWTTPVPRYRDCDPPLACPHCHARSTRFRDLDTALVCPACGRSFTAPR